MTLEERCDRALAAVLARTDTEHEWHIADRAVALHCLGCVAPRFFERHALQPVLDRALEGLARVPTEFPLGIEWEQTMARLDAHYFRALHGLANPPLPVADFLRSLADVVDQSLLVGWLLAELAGALGVDVEIPDPSSLSGAERTYWRTHQVLLWTSYLRDPLEVDASEALDELERGLPVRLALGEIDPAAEAIFCLRKGGRELDARYVEALAERQRDDGSFFEASDVGDERSEAHCTVVCLIALAGELER
jgi:hypothetical protein